MQFDTQKKELALKLVYYGPALSGKTTNLQAIHGFIDPKNRGRLMTLNTQDDRTLFFDLLPVYFRTATGFTVRIKLYTVPGQVIHEATRRIVLQSTDGVAFIADSQNKEALNNNTSWKDLISNLGANNFDPEIVPKVIQFNKRDLPDIKSDEEIVKIAKKGKEPVYKAVAVEGLGVLDTLYGLLRMVWIHIEKKHQLERKLGISSDQFLDGIFHSFENT